MQRMKFYIDTEFHEDGPDNPIRLISLAIVCQDGRELYLENLDYDKSAASDWLKQNVLPHLRPAEYGVPFAEIGDRIKKFVHGCTGTMVRPEFWGYFADYDWVVMCQCFGRMIDLPGGWPMYCRDLKQLADHLGVEKSSFPKQASGEHFALADARWNLILHRFLSPVPKQ